MELKRGWWKKRGGGYAFVVVFRDGWWHGLDSDLTSDTWLPDGRYTDSKQPRGDDLITYCGDGPEPVEPEKQPDPRDAEIERLKAENEKLLNAINSQSSEINRLLTKCQRLDVKLATIKTEYNNLARIIGDH